MTAAISISKVTSSLPSLYMDVLQFGLVLPEVPAFLVRGRRVGVGLVLLGSGRQPRHRAAQRGVDRQHARHRPGRHLGVVKILVTWKLYLSQTVLKEYI